MATITAVVHTRNSQNTLEMCLKSLAWCDEVFVVDMGSDDKTLTIAKKYGASIFAADADLVYADPIRNEYLRKVKTDWTLIVDSDEEVPPTLAKKLQQLSLVAGIDGYSVPRKNLIFGKWAQYAGYWPDYIVRFFRTGKATYPPSVHSQPIIDGKHEFLPPQEQYAFIHHHYATIFDFMNRLNVYTSLEVEKILRKKKEWSPLEALREFFSEFHRRFFQMEGYRDGSYGLVLSLLSSVYQLVSYLKAWEVSKAEIAYTLDDVEEEVTQGCASTSYWVANEQLKEKAGLVKKISLKLRRKLHS